MVTPGFGFSAGEFIKAMQTLDTFRKALKDIGGPAADYEETLQRLNHLSVVLQHLQALQSDESSMRQDHVIRDAANACYEQLKCFIVKQENLLPDIGPEADIWHPFPLDTMGIVHEQRSRQAVEADRA